MIRLFQIAALAVALVVAQIGSASAQFPDQRTWGGTSGGTANAQTLSIPNISSFNDIVGVEIRFLAGSTNTGDTSMTIAPLSAGGIRKTSRVGLLPLSGREIAAGQVHSLVWNGSFYVLANPTVPNRRTYQLFNSPASGTYNTPSGATQIVVTMCAGGGGGGGVIPSGNGTNGGSGGNTTFGNTSTVGGSGGGGNNTTAGGTQGSGGAGGSTGTGVTVWRAPGGSGDSGISVNAVYSAVTSGRGAPSIFGGGGGATTGNQAAQSGQAPCAGGGGAPNQAATNAGSGGGGGSGESVTFYINDPASQYTYTVGAAGSASGGGQGAAGQIIVEEHYD